MSNPYKHVTLKLGHAASGGVAVLTFNRPSKKNAINGPMYVEIGNALAEASSHDGTTAVILTGNGDYYSAGNDLANFSKLMHPKKIAAEAKIMCYNFVDSFIECQKPIVAAANGPAIGIPVTTMGLCDYRLAVPSATFHTPFRALGQAPEGCSSFTFPRIFGKEMSHKILDEGYKFGAEEGARIGFIDRLSADREQLMSDAMKEALRLGAAGGRWFDKEPGMRHELKRVNAFEVEVLEEAWISEECFTALSNYLASRNQRLPAAVLKALNLTRRFWQ